MANNQKMLDKAKHESEIDFCNCLVADNIHYVDYLNANVEFIHVLHNSYENDDNYCIAKRLDCQYHIDVFAQGKWLDLDRNEKTTTFFFDVKDVEDKNISTKNYTIPSNEIDFFEKTTDAYYLAFRLNDGASRKLSKYVVVNAKGLCQRKNGFIDKGRYFLVSLDHINKCLDKFEIEGDF